MPVLGHAFVGLRQWPCVACLAGPRVHRRRRPGSRGDAFAAGRARGPARDDPRPPRAASVSGWARSARASRALAIDHQARSDRLCASRGIRRHGRSAARGDLYCLRAYRADRMYFWAVADLALFYASSDAPEAERRRLAASYLSRLRSEFAGHPALPEILARVEAEARAPLARRGTRLSA